jgi:hypothetical protein
MRVTVTIKELEALTIAISTLSEAMQTADEEFIKNNTISLMYLEELRIKCLRTKK